MKDLLKDDAGDMQITNDDLVIGYSDQQQRADLLLLEKGELKVLPGVGVGARSFLEAEDEGGLYREINLQFSADGMQINKIELTGGKLLIDAPYQ